MPSDQCADLNVRPDDLSGLEPKNRLALQLLGWHWVPHSPEILPGAIHAIAEVRAHFLIDSFERLG